MNAPHPLAARLLARVGSAGRENLRRDAGEAGWVPFRLENEGAHWLVFLHESLAHTRANMRAMEDRFQRLAEGLSALMASLEGFADALRQEPPPDVDEPDAAD